MRKHRVISGILILCSILLGWFVFFSVTFPFKLGLDLSGGSQLLYRADVAGVPEGEVKGAMNGLRDVIERRVNLFGVSEPVVQIERSGFLAGAERENRLIVELPGVTDLEQAVKLIGETPLLEFKLVKEIEGTTTPNIIDTGLTGRFLEKSRIEFTGQGGQFGSPVVALRFTSEGSDLFAKITRENVGKILAVYLDGAPISIPVIQEEITGGEAVITGDFSAEEAKILVGRLNSGALPVPIELISVQKIGAALGERAVNQGVRAGIISTILVALFLIFWYRLPGLIAVIALGIYVIVMLALFKLIPVTLTAAGIAGFILSIGMAVDANILIFERSKEELKKGASIDGAVHEGFARAWPSIRDSNVSSMITALILFWLGTSLVKGFALTFGIGVLVSMFTAITVTRNFLYALGVKGSSSHVRFWYSSGLSKLKIKD